MRIVSIEEIRRVIGPREAFRSAEIAFRAMAEGRVRLPLPMALSLPERRGEVHIKAAHLAGAPVFTVKIVSGFGANAADGTPVNSGYIGIFDSASGHPLGILLDGGYLTDLRTAAAGTLAATLLAPRDLAKIAIIGTGVQAREQLRALTHAGRKAARTMAWGRSHDALDAYCREMRLDPGVAVLAASSPEEAVRDADLIVTATAAREPIVEAGWLAPSATVVAVGADMPEKRELGRGVLSRAEKIVVDSVAQCSAFGELHHGLADGDLAAGDVYAELGEIASGRKAGREGPEMIVCDLTGLGAQDAAIGEVAWSQLVH
jgi:ornithine cyclodeaminase/alanine dehydrogenase-like protein (mu-crystallin family)